MQQHLSEVDRLQEQVRTLREENERLGIRFTKLKAIYNPVRRGRNNARKECEDLRDQLTAVTEERDKYKKCRDEWYKRCLAYIKERNSLYDTVKKLKGELSQFVATIPEETVMPLSPVMDEIRRELEAQQQSAACWDKLCELVDGGVNPLTIYALGDHAPGVEARMDCGPHPRAFYAPTRAECLEKIEEATK